MAIVKNKSSSTETFSSSSTPEFLTKTVEVSNDQKTPATDASTKSTQTSEDNSSFGFFVPDSSKVRSFFSVSKKSSPIRRSSSTLRYSNSSKSSIDRSDSDEQDRKFEDKHKREDRKESSSRFPRKSSREDSLSNGLECKDNIDIENISPENIISAPDLRSKSLTELIKAAEEYGAQNVSRSLKHNIISSILKAASSQGKTIHDIGIIEIVSDSFGFLRYKENNYAPSSDNIYVSQSQVRKFSLKTGDIVEGYAKEPRKSEKYFPMFKISKINGCPVDQIQNVLHFDNFIPIFPTEKLNLDINIGPKETVSTRVIDIIAPIGKGQRALIVAPPRSGKTVIMKNIAHAINANNPEVKLIALLIDERPEEFTDMKKYVEGEVISSTFDEPAERHVALAEIVISKAKRMVEQGQDVVILLDSITRLARAYNATAPSSGKILTGGIDSNALQRPKRFFGAARNIKEAGSLTIIATALTETGSKMDEVIFEEFKGRGNSEIVLDRRLADKRMFPAIDVLRSGTRNEEEMVSSETLSKMWALRKIISGMSDQGKVGSADAIDFLLKEIKKTSNNKEFFIKMNG